MLPGFGIPFVFARHYRSGVAFQSTIGYGWNHTFGRRLIRYGDTYVSEAGGCPNEPDPSELTAGSTTS
jgi:hypothetical protein